MISLSAGLVLLFFTVGLFAGTIDAIAGGGGLISLPLLIGVGMPAPIALGTSKFQGCVGTFVATHNYFKNKLISFHILIKGLLFGFIGATAGALTAQVMDAVILEKILPLLMLGIFLYTLFTPKLGLLDKKERMKESIFYPLFGFLLGFYDGFLGPGTGSFWVIALVFFLGYNLSKATAYTKVFNLKSNVIAIAWFMLGHNIDYRIAFIMGCGQFIGGKIGSQLVILNGATFVRPVFLTMVLFAIVVMFCKSYVPMGEVNKIVNLVGMVPMLVLCIIAVVSLATVLWVRQNNRLG
ncbi:MAG TPA: TSUP family transporter [Gammaproteobacteria bacterium]|jgi:uncharacterized membrane protein YfcA|nr:TSUP family transporter [Gammaproteobacteria bacterium]